MVLFVGPQGACYYGYILLSRSPTLIRLMTPNSGIMEFQPLHTLEFSSDRKRMSIIVRERSSGTITLYSKGADSVIFSRLSPNGIANVTQQHLDQYGRRGLRTLCLAKKVRTYMYISSLIIIVTTLCLYIFPLSCLSPLLSVPSLVCPLSCLSSLLVCPLSRFCLMMNTTIGCLIIKMLN